MRPGSTSSSGPKPSRQLKRRIRVFARSPTLSISKRLMFQPVTLFT
jgi:hypothetical protein